MVKVCQKQLRNSFDGEIVSVSLKPTDFGDKRIVLENRVKSYPTMVAQILTALEASTTSYVFFTEDDVLYHPSHFDFTPARNDIYYYNVNNWRWRWGTDIAVTYDELHSLSGLCCNRELAIRHYKYREKVMKEQGLDKDRAREPRWARRFGYEPGTKPIHRGGITDEGFETWRSEYPNIDIRHKGTFSHPKTFLREFKHPPSTFRETTIDKIEGWENIKSMFGL
jgi:hypothetical protein